MHADVAHAAQICKQRHNTGSDLAAIPQLSYDVNSQATAHEVCMQLLTDLHTSDGM